MGILNCRSEFTGYYTNRGTVGVYGDLERHLTGRRCCGAGLQSSPPSPDPPPPHPPRPRHSSETQARHDPRPPDPPLHRGAQDGRSTLPSLDQTDLPPQESHQTRTPLPLLLPVRSCVPARSLPPARRGSSRKTHPAIGPIPARTLPA